MKKLLIGLVVLAAAVAFGCNSNAGNGLQSSLKDQVHQFDTANFTSIQWLDSIKDFGEVTQGEKVKIVFQFVNTGDKPLYLAEVKPGCGCTLADYTKSAVLPGKEGEITAEYDSNHGFPNQPVRKTISVTCNARNKTHSTLVFTGTVKAKA
ncbi:MAG TPA: DUF1573 domain-containing protein [Chitinophagaceae bacterium]|jgi:hypothetical protein|nr:DUF1573 domain-containing protein [Chitinophagaceae bacterium]